MTTGMRNVRGVRCRVGLQLLGMAICLQGCGTLEIPKPVRSPSTLERVPSTWVSAGPNHSGLAESGWIHSLGDVELEALVAEALVENRNLRIAAARLKAARETTIMVGAGRLPTLGAGFSAEHSEIATRSGSGKLGSFRGAEHYSLSANASWEVDLWGRLANLHRASKADLESDGWQYKAARLSLAANTVKAWCNMITARLQVELAEQTRDSFDRNQRIVERNYKAGDIAASPLDVQFARNQLASTERGLIAQRLALNEAQRTLELLMGRYPAGSIRSHRDLPVLKDHAPAGLPSDLLLRRPDLMSLAAELRATAERADATRKSLLPSVSLSMGGASGASVELLDLVANPASLAGSIAASVAQPLYRGGALKAQARQSLAFNEAAIESFANATLRAFRETESALATEQSLAQQHNFLETEVRQANLAETQATRDYSEGIVGYLSVLEAQRRAFNARSALITLRNARIQTRVDLHLALGGDFMIAGPDASHLSKHHD